MLQFCFIGSIPTASLVTMQEATQVIVKDLNLFYLCTGTELIHRMASPRLSLFFLSARLIGRSPVSDLAKACCQSNEFCLK